MKIKPEYESGAIAIPKRALDLAVNCPDDALKALIYLCEHMTDDGCEEAGIDSDTMKKAVRFWRAAGIIAADGNTEKKPDKKGEKPDKPRESAVPSYTGRELERIMKAREGLSALIDTAQNMLGKVFTPSEAGVIVMMRDHLELDDEYIILLIEYCRSRGKTSVRYIEKTALSLFDEGIDSVAALDAYIKAREKTDGLEAFVRKLFGMGERALTKKERGIISSWAEQNVSRELVEKAYELMIPHVTKPSLSYQNSIIMRWISEGVTTPEQAENGKTGKGSFDTDELFALALERGKKLINGDKQEG